MGPPWTSDLLVLAGNLELVPDDRRGRCLGPVSFGVPLGTFSAYELREGIRDEAEWRSQHCSPFNRTITSSTPLVIVGEVIART